MHSTAIVATALLIGVLAVVPFARAADAWEDAYEKKNYEDVDGRRLPYRLLKPEKVEPGKKYPLVLFLHGKGERGSDNEKQLAHGLCEFARPENRRKHPCFVIAPQCPPDDRWVLTEHRERLHRMAEKPTDAIRLVLELFDRSVEEMPVDKSRIYVTGLSMGGFATWDIICRRPNFFAAAMPICGGGDATQASKLIGLPIWAFHGGSDSVVPPLCTSDMVEAIQCAGGSPKMTIYSGVGHDSWTQTYADPKALDWLFSQRKP